MRTSTPHLVAFVTAAALGALTWPAFAQETQSQATYRDIEQTLGSVPGFFKQMPATAIAGAWAEMKTFQLNPGTQLDGKTKGDTDTVLNAAAEKAKAAGRSQ
jgi:hypothetical protein